VRKIPQLTEEDKKYGVRNPLFKKFGKMIPVPISYEDLNYLEQLAEDNDEFLVHLLQRIIATSVEEFKSMD
jgi:hypothetical protein